MNLSHNNTKATAASGGHPMTASSLKKGGRLGREQAMHGGQVTGETRLRHCHRGSLTYLSQLTPSQQPFMSDDRGWPKPEIATSQLGLNEKNQFYGEPPLLQGDAQNLVNFRITEDLKAGASNKALPDAKTPYLFLQKPSNQAMQTMAYEHSKKRIFFSTVAELDQAVSEPNTIKDFNYKHSMSFQNWYETLKQRSED